MELASDGELRVVSRDGPAALLAECASAGWLFVFLCVRDRCAEAGAEAYGAEELWELALPAVSGGR